MSKVVSALPVRVVVYKRADEGLKQAFYSLPLGLLEVLNFSEKDFSTEVVRWFTTTILPSGSSRNILYNAVILDPCWHGKDNLLWESEAEFLKEIHNVSSDNAIVSVRAMYAGIKNIDVSLGSNSRADIEFIDDAENFIESVFSLIDTEEFLKTIKTIDLPDKVREFLKDFYNEASNPEVFDFYKYFTTQSLFRKTIKDVLKNSGVDLFSLAFYFLFPPNSLVAVDSYDETNGRWVRIFTGLISSQNYRISFGNEIEYSISAISLPAFLKNKVELEDNIWSNIFTVFKYESTSERKLSKPLSSILTSLFFASYPNILDYIIDLTKSTFSGFMFKRNANITSLFDYALKLANLVSGSKLIAPDDLALTYIAMTKIIPGAYQANTKSLDFEEEKEPTSPEQSNQRIEEKFSFIGQNDSVTEFIINIGKEIISEIKRLYKDLDENLAEKSPLLDKTTFSISSDKDFHSRAFDSLRLRFYLFSKVLNEFNAKYEEKLNKYLETYKISLENTVGVTDYEIDINKKVEEKKDLLMSEKNAIARLIHYFAGICAIYDYIVWNYSPLVFLTPYGGLFSEIYDFDFITKRYDITLKYYKHFINFISEGLSIGTKVFDDFDYSSVDKFFTEEIINKFNEEINKSGLYNDLTDRITVHPWSYFLDKVLVSEKNVDIVSLGKFYKYKQSISSISFDATLLAFAEAILSKFDIYLNNGENKKVNKVTTLDLVTYFLYSATISSNIFTFFSGEKIKVSRIIDDISSVLGLILVETPYGHIILTPVKLYGSGRPKDASDDLTKVMANIAKLVENKYVFYKDLPYKEDLSKIPLKSYSIKDDFTVERVLSCFSVKPFYGKVNISIKQNIDGAYSNFSIPFSFDFVDLGDTVKNTIFNISAVDPALLFQGAKNSEDISKLNFPTQLIALKSILTMFFEDIFGVNSNGTTNSEVGIAANRDNMIKFITSGETSIKYTVDAKKYYPGVSGVDEIDVVIDFQDSYSAYMVFSLIHFIDFLYGGFENNNNVEDKKKFVHNFFSALFYYYLVYRAIYANSSINTIDISVTDFKPSNLSVLGNLLFVPQFNYIGIVRNIRVSIRPGSEVKQDIKLSNVIPLAFLPYLPPISGAEIIAFASSYLLNIKPSTVRFDELVFLNPKDLAPEFFAFLLGGVYFSRILGVLSKELGGLNKSYLLAGCLKKGALRVKQKDGTEVELGNILISSREAKLAVRFIYSIEKMDIDFSSDEAMGKRVYGYDFDTMFKLIPEKIQIGVLVDTLRNFAAYQYLGEFARKYGSTLGDRESVIFYVEKSSDLGQVDSDFYKGVSSEYYRTSKLLKFTLDYSKKPFDEDIFNEIIRQDNIKLVFEKNITGNYLKFIPFVDISLQTLEKLVFTVGGSEVMLDTDKYESYLTYTFLDYIKKDKDNPECYGFDTNQEVRNNCLFCGLVYNDETRFNLAGLLASAVLVHDARTFNWIFSKFIDNSSVENNDSPAYEDSAMLGGKVSTFIQLGSSYEGKVD